MKFLVVPIDKTSVSFCYYGNSHRGSDPEPIPKEILQRAVEYAKANELTINFLYGRKKPPAAYRSIIESVSHAKIVPIDLADAYPDSVVVIESRELDRTDSHISLNGRNVIVRLDKKRIPRLASTVGPLLGTFQRLNVCITDMEKITDKELDTYSQQLTAIVPSVADRYRRGDIFELNFLSDRMILDSMKNCEAGCEHLTVGPDGRLYLCPGFLYDNPESAVGSLSDGIRIPNQETPSPRPRGAVFIVRRLSL